MGECRPADQVYTITKGISQSDLDMLTSAVQSIGRVELGRVDLSKGVMLHPDSIAPNFDILSFSYLPKINERYSALCCSSLRSSLKDKNIRGSKELSHLVMFDGMPDGFYVIDMMRSDYFKERADINVEEANSYIDHDGTYIVCESKPDGMPQITFDLFPSNPLKIEDIRNAGDKTLQRVSEIFHGLVVSKRERKRLYIVYNPDDYQTILAYLTITLKLMPSKVANQFSFVTCLGKTSSVDFDICCIPTTDKEYISELKSEGNVIIVTGFESCYINESKGKFAEFLACSKTDEFEQWLAESQRYLSYVTKIEQMDDIASLYVNTLRKDFAGDNLETSVYELGSSIRIVSEKLELIDKINGELDRQVEAISKRLELTLGAVELFSISDIKNHIIMPVFDLYDKCKSNNDIVDKIFGWLKSILFGTYEQPSELQQKHFEIISRCFQLVQERLSENYVSFIAYLSNDWDNLHMFFFNYLNEKRFEDDSNFVVLSILSCLLQNLSYTRVFRSDMRDELTFGYLRLWPDKFISIAEYAFSGSDRFRDIEFGFIFDKVFDYTTKDEVYKPTIKQNIDKWLDDVVLVLSHKGLLMEAVNYIKERYKNEYNEDKCRIIEKEFLVLLNNYFRLSLPEIIDFKFLYSSFEEAKNIVGENPKPSLIAFVFKCWYKNIAEMNYISAINSLHYDEITDEDIAKYKTALEYLKTPALRNVISRNFLSAYEGFIDEYTIYITQKKREGGLLNDRINFVAREIMLLDNKTILKILTDEDYLGKTKVASDLQQLNIVKPKKDRRVADYAKEETIKYLLNKKSENKVKFCSRVRQERSAKFVDYRVRSKDIFTNIIGSSIFTIVFAIITAVIGFLFCERVLDSYFRSIYILFVIAIAIISEIIYWANYRNRRLRNLLVMSIWQMVLMLFATLGVYMLIQFALISLGI